MPNGRFFPVTVDGQALLGMPDIELLSILRIACDVTYEPHEGRKFDSQTTEVSNSQVAEQSPKKETDKVGMHDGSISMPDYIRTNANKAAHEKVSEV